jgi:hypothetical protein
MSAQILQRRAMAMPDPPAAPAGTFPVPAQFPGGEHLQVLANHLWTVGPEDLVVELDNPRCVMRPGSVGPRLPVFDQALPDEETQDRPPEEFYQVHAFRVPIWYSSGTKGTPARPAPCDDRGSGGSGRNLAGTGIASGTRLGVRFGLCSGQPPSVVNEWEHA